MATNTRKNSGDVRAGEQPTYQYEPWDSDTGKFSSHINGQSDTPQAKSNQNSQADATNSLRHAENSAISGHEPSYNNHDSKSNDSLYTGSGRSKTNDNSKNPLKPKDLKSMLKGKGAVITIAMVLLGIAGFLGFSNSLLPAALSTLLTNNTQTNYTSYTLRSKFITSYMMKSNSGGAVTTGFTGKVKYTSIPTKLKTRLAKYNIEVEGTGSSTIMRWNGEDINATKFLDMYNNNVEFREAYTNARYGRAATFYDKAANAVYKKLGISRNLQKDYVQTSDAELNAETYDETLRPKFEGSTTSLVTDSPEDTVTGYDEDDIYIDKKNDAGEVISSEYYGTELTEKNDNVSSSGGGKTGTADTDVEARAQAKSLIASVAGRVGQVGNGICTIMKIGSMIATAASAQEMYQSINFFMAQMESISKMKAGYGDQSGINTFLNYMTTTETTDVQDYSPSAISSLFDISMFDKSNWEDKETATQRHEVTLGQITNEVITADKIEPTTSDPPMQTETGAPVEASGLQVMLADAPATPEDTQNYSLERIIKSMGGTAAFGAGTALACAGVSIVNSLMSLAVTLSPAGVVSVLGNLVTKFAQSAVVSYVIGGFFSFLVPTLAKIFFRNVMDTAVGIPGGQFLAEGAAAANMSNSRRGSGQSPSDEATILSYNHTTNEVLALEAEQDRYRLSPFDTSSPNTFFGSIAYSLLPTFTSTNMTGLSSFLRSTSTSLASIVRNGVSAEGENSSYITTFGECPLLDEIGAKGDLYCNPITTTDMSTIEMSPDDGTFNDVLMDGNLECDEEGNCTVVKDSNLYKYINYCTERDSPMGVVDQNILSQLQAGNVVISSIPVIGELFDIFNAVNDIFGDNINWANGTRCGNTTKNQEFWSTEAKYYQRYVEDQRILNQMGAYDTESEEGEDDTNNEEQTSSIDPVTAAKLAYEADHPTDDTYLGYLSRISGLDLENTETVLAFVMYYTYVDSYDPTIRLAVEDFALKLSGEEVTLQAQTARLDFNEEQFDNPLETNSTDHEYIIYADVRNRSFAA